MNLGDISLACATSLVDGLVDGGVAHASLSPGSRSTPLALALASDPRVQVHVQLDERSSGFFALGAAKATGRPAIVACTSGTAAAELLPAVVEASQSRMPLIVLTADRPPRLRGTGANQTIVQPGALRRVRPRFLRPAGAHDGRAGSMVAPGGARGDRGDGHRPGRSRAPELPVRGAAHPERRRRARPPGRGAARRTRTPGRGPRSGRDRSADRAGLRETGGDRGRRTPGAPQGRIALLVGSDGMARPRGTDLRRSRPGDRPRRRTDPDRESLVGGTSPRGRHPVRRVPDQSVDAASRRVRRPARRRGSMAPRSGPRPSGIVAAGRRSGRPARGARTTPGDAARDRHRAHGRPHGVGDRGSLARPDRSRARRVARRVERRRCPGPRHDGRVDGRVGRAVRAEDRPRRGGVDPGRGRLFVGNSTPIRDLDLAMRPRRNLTVMANRGASGIDGLVSTALGISVARPGPTVALRRRPLVPPRCRRGAVERDARVRSHDRRGRQRRRSRVLAPAATGSPRASRALRHTARRRHRRPLRGGRRRPRAGRAGVGPAAGAGPGGRRRPRDQRDRGRSWTPSSGCGAVRAARRPSTRALEGL